MDFCLSVLFCTAVQCPSGKLTDAESQLQGTLLAQGELFCVYLIYLFFFKREKNISQNFLQAELFIVPYIANRQFWKDLLQRLGIFLGKVQNYFNFFLLVYDLGSCLMWDGNVRLLEVKISADETERYQAYFQPLKQNHHRGSRRNATEGPAIEKSPYNVSYKYRYFSTVPLTVLCNKHCVGSVPTQLQVIPHAVKHNTQHTVQVREMDEGATSASQKHTMHQGCQSFSHMQSPTLRPFIYLQVLFSVKVWVVQPLSHSLEVGVSVVLTGGKRKKMKTFYSFDSPGMNLEKMGASFTKYILYILKHRGKKRY